MDKEEETPIFNPDWAVHPWEHVEEYKELLRLENEDIARMMGVGIEIIEDFSNDKMSIDADFAKKLEKVFGMKSVVWSALQETWDRKKAQGGEHGFRIS